jgi:hypothetical protein
MDKIHSLTRGPHKVHVRTVNQIVPQLIEVAGDPTSALQSPNLTIETDAQSRLIRGIHGRDVEWIVLEPVAWSAS